MFDLGRHAQLYPNIVYERQVELDTTTVDQLVSTDVVAHLPDLIVIDTQGADLKVLRGATTTLKTANSVVVEVSHEPLYEGGSTFMEVLHFLFDQGFRLWRCAFTRRGWGDALFVRPTTSDPSDDLPSWGGNLALGKPATQSSRSRWSAADDPQGAVNGRKTGGYGFHTDRERNPWWQVDLGAPHAINEVRVYNRCDTGEARARTLTIHLSRDGKAWEQVWDQDGVAFGGVVFGPLRALINGRQARYVRLALGDVEYLHLDEVEIY
jgi:hypothetical protein